MSSAAFDVLGICAHPDDAELVMGGTLAAEAKRGRRLALLDLTRGESGSRGDPATREREALSAATILGVAHRESLGLPDARLFPGGEERDLVVAALRRLRPRVVVTQHWEQRHPDHSAAGRLVYDACFVAGLRNYRPDLGAAWRPVKVVYALSMTEAAETAPTFVVDITDTWPTKLRAITAFASQFTRGEGETVRLPFDRFLQTVEVTARRHGQRIGVDYGEGFLTREPLRVDDLMSLDVSSI
ncbi:MAG TPA: bacillithiol biosynthesis deacetylase BshB1 [Vicinamibacteria bacterium]|nr:bacillithiol biosynthesis deacetylase BshB1 [Vicinamibacteria bacterium]